MKFFITFFISIALLTVGVSAHSVLRSSVPMDKSVLEKGPEEIILNFSYEIRLTSLTLNQNNESKKLDFEIKSFAKMFSAKSPVKNNGPYEILWRGLSRDGHIVTGTFSYYVKP